MASDPTPRWSTTGTWCGQVGCWERSGLEKQQVFRPRAGKGLFEELP